MATSSTNSSTTTLSGSTSGADTLSGSSDSDTLRAGAGDDLLIYNISQNGEAAQDVYTGGSGIDTVLIEFTLQQWLLASNQLQIAAYMNHLATYNNQVTGEVSNGSGSDFTFSFGASTLKVQMMEKLMITVDGVYQDPADALALAVDDTAGVTEDSTCVAINVLGNDSVPDLVKSVTLGDAPAYGTATLVKPDPSKPATWYFDYQVNRSELQSLAVGQSRSDSFTYAVMDADGDVSTAAVTITITGTNDAPVAVADAAEGAHDQPLTIDVLANDTDVDDNHSLTLVSAHAPAGKGSASVLHNQLVFTAGADFAHLSAGTREVVTIEYSMRDEHGAESSSSVSITVIGTNHAPVAVADTATGGENETITVDVLANDTDADDGHAFTLLAASAPAGQGSASVVAGQLVFNPGTAFDHLAQGDTDSVLVEYTMQDEHGAQSSSTATITITGANDAAVITGSSTGTVLEAGGVNNAQSNVGTVTGALDIVDIDDGQASFQAAASGTPASYGTYSVTTEGHWTYTLDNDGFGVQALNGAETLIDTFTVLALDGTSHAVAVTIEGADDASVITGEISGSVREAGGVNNTDGGTSTTSGVLVITDADSTGAVFAPVLSGSAEYGTYVLTSDGKWSYTLDNNDSLVQALTSFSTLTDSFLALSAHDGTAQRVDVTIHGTNDAAVVTGTSTGTVTEAGATGVPGTPTASGDLHATDVDNLNDHFQSDVAGVARYGTYTVDQNGRWVYTLDNDNPAVQVLDTGNSLNDEFSVATVDGTLNKVFIAIEGRSDAINQAPTSITLTPLSWDDGLNGGVLMGFSTTDADVGDSHSYLEVDIYGSIPLSTDSLWVSMADTPSGSRDFTIRSTDADGASIDVIFSLFVYGEGIDNHNVGRAWSEVVFGGGGDDRLAGAQDDDFLFGQSGDDDLNGVEGNDWLYGGAGSDYLWGGAGADMFVLSSAIGSTNVDSIADFVPGQDKIVLENTGAGLFNALGTGGLVEGAFATDSGFGASTTSSTRIIYNASTGELKYDTDGSGAIAAQLIAVLGEGNGAPALEYSDFLVI